MPFLQKSSIFGRSYIKAIREIVESHLFQDLMVTTSSWILIARSNRESKCNLVNIGAASEAKSHLSNDVRFKCFVTKFSSVRFFDGNRSYVSGSGTSGCL